MAPTAAIITIGTELLIGQVADTNSTFIAGQLTTAGYTVKRKYTIADDAAEINTALKQALKAASIIIITGGLGPTNDDVTKNCLAEYFNAPLVTQPEVLAHVTKIFADKNLPLLPANRAQALIPRGSTALFNSLGTAPGIHIVHNGQHIFALPGVPFEMEALLTGQVIPLLTAALPPQPVIHKTLVAAGISESFLARALSPVENDLPHNIALAYLPAHGVIRLRLNASGNNTALLHSQLNNAVQAINKHAGKYIYAYDDISLEEIIGSWLQPMGRTICTAESCTGGYLAHMLSRRPGSGNFFLGGAVTYTYALKQNILKVSPATLQQHTAVSQAAAIEMAQGALHLFNATYAIATTGVLGPGTGGETAPVGTVWIAIAEKGKTVCRQFNFNKPRSQNIIQASHAALILFLQNFVKQQD